MVTLNQGMMVMDGAELGVENEKDIHGIGVVASSVGLSTGVSVTKHHEDEAGVFKE